MSKLSNNIKYFSHIEEENNYFSEEYEKVREKLNLKNEDLFFFSPDDYEGKEEDIRKMNKFTLADYMDLIDIDCSSGYKVNTKKDLINYSCSISDINDNILKANSDNVSFSPAVNLNNLIENFTKVLFDKEIDEILISSGSIHAMRYSFPFSSFSDEDKEKIKENLKNTKIEIIYGPFALLEENESNQFIKFLFDSKLNLELKRDNSDKYRMHFFYTRKNNNHNFIFETAHREYLIRRNIIELNISDKSKNDAVLSYLKDTNNLKDDSKIKRIYKYNEFTSEDYSENIKNYFSVYKSSRMYLKYKEKYYKK